MECLFLMASATSTAPVAQKAQYDWTAVVIALLIALGLVGGFFVIQMFNDWLHRTLSRTRRRDPGGEPSNHTANGGKNS